MRALSAAVLILLTACSTYRSTTSSYRSNVGGYRVPSDYARGPSGDYTIESKTLPYFPQGTFQLSWPVRNVKLNRGFRPKSDPDHDGIDLGGKKGSPILAAHEGLVIYTGSDFRGYGKMVLVEYSDEWASLYAHLDSIHVVAGQVVQPGASVGAMGRTGRATGVHLHFELLHKRKPVDPLPFLSRINRFARNK